MTYQLVTKTTVTTAAAAAKHELISQYFDYDKVYYCYNFAADALAAIDNAINTAQPADIRHVFEKSRNHLQLLLNRIIEVLTDVKKFTRQKMDCDWKFKYLSGVFNDLMDVAQQILPSTPTPPPPQESITY